MKDFLVCTTPRRSYRHFLHLDLSQSLIISRKMFIRQKHAQSFQSAKSPQNDLHYSVVL